MSPKEGILHAVQHCVFIGTPDEEMPAKQLFLGFDSGGLLLELVVLRLDDGGEPVIHAMKARRHYHGLLG